MISAIKIRMNTKQRASRNRTLSCTPEETIRFGKLLRSLDSTARLDSIEDQIICQDTFAVLPFLPKGCFDLLVLDPPYNLSKHYNEHLFQRKEKAEYQRWFEKMFLGLLPLLAPHASLYVCSDWRTSILVAPLLESLCSVQNRITWEREKGRGAKQNWKNNTEDIWFCTVSAQYTFNVDAVKLKRKVLAPYRHRDGSPKDWEESDEGKYRLTHPSNIWTDLTVPFWSMPENTDHPTQKPEKLIAKLLLASSNPGDLVLDPFLGSGTTAVVAKKLGRKFVGIEQSQEYCCWAMKRLERAAEAPSIQGYAQGVFWERNSFAEQPPNHEKTNSQQKALFG